MAATYDIPVEQGATLRLAFVRAEADEDGVPQPVPLRNVVAKMQIRLKARASQAVLTLTSDTTSPDYSPHANLTLEPDGETGRIDVYLGATATDQLVRDCVYDLELHSTTNADEVIRLIQGAIKVNLQVTR